MISVLIPTFNRADVLEKALPYYLKNALVSEVIIVDDGSTDKTPDLLQQWSQQEDKIHYIKQPHNQGSVAARNVLLQQVKTPYFFMADDDTYPGEDTLAHLLSALKTHNYAAVAPRIVYLNEQRDECASLSNNTSPLIDINRLYFNFNSAWQEEVITLPGLYLAQTKIVKHYTYDPHYQGSAWREESDFGLQLSLDGHTLYFLGNAPIYEFPKTTHSGGQWSRPLREYIQSAIANNRYFLKKFETELRTQGILTTPLWQLRLRFRIQMLRMYCIVRLKQCPSPKAIMWLRQWYKK